jgi:hypothetical protein
MVGGARGSPPLLLYFMRVGLFRLSPPEFQRRLKVGFQGTEPASLNA